MEPAGSPRIVKWGFTLIEIIIVIAIIALMAGFGWNNFSGAQKTARDAKRKQELASSRAALESYANEKSHFYPPADSGVSLTSSVCATLGLDKYMTCASNSIFDYTYQTVNNGQEFCVWSNLEKTDNCYKMCSCEASGEFPKTSGMCALTDICGTAVPPVGTPSITPASSPTPTAGASTPPPMSSPTPPPGNVASADLAQIILSLDCTGSMLECADGSKTSPCSGKTKYEALRDSTISLINNVRNQGFSNVRFGLAVFDTGAQWLTDGNGTLAPENPLGLTPDQHYQRAIDAINNRFSSIGSAGCPELIGESGYGTNIGAGIKFGNDYFRNNPVPAGATYVRSTVVISDGEASMRSSDAACPPGMALYGGPATEFPSSYYVKEARDYIRCQAATTSTNWAPGEKCTPADYPACTNPMMGRRRSTTDLYGVLIGLSSSATADVFHTFAGPNSYFSDENSNNLANILINNIWDQIN